MQTNLLTVDPQLASQIGVEGALLLGFFQQQSLLSDGRVRTNLKQLVSFFPFWDDAKVLHLLEQLQQQQRLRFRLQQAELELIIGSVNKQMESQTPAGVSVPPPKARVLKRSAVQQLPVVDKPVESPVPSRPLGHAPTFGRKQGWRKPSELDEIFNAAEQARKQLREMDLDWRPSQTFYELLSRTRIERQFADGCIDEFIAYYVERGKAESNWDQRFLKWVKQAWPDEETKRSRTENFDAGQQTGKPYEKSRQDTRESRKRVTAAVMDIKNIDW